MAEKSRHCAGLTIGCCSCLQDNADNAPPDVVLVIAASKLVQLHSLLLLACKVKDPAAQRSRRRHHSAHHSLSRHGACMEVAVSTSQCDSKQPGSDRTQQQHSLAPATHLEEARCTQPLSYQVKLSQAKIYSAGDQQGPKDCGSIVPNKPRTLCYLT